MMRSILFPVLLFAAGCGDSMGPPTFAGAWSLHGQAVDARLQCALSGTIELSGSPSSYQGSGSVTITRTYPEGVVRTTHPSTLLGNAGTIQVRSADKGADQLQMALRSASESELLGDWVCAEVAGSLVRGTWRLERRR